ncbi:hypothetical protein Trydic_g6960 [Trypoxylus dichotomus]
MFTCCGSTPWKTCVIRNLRRGYERVNCIRVSSTSIASSQLKDEEYAGEENHLPVPMISKVPETETSTINVEELYDYIKRAICNKQFEKEFQTLPKEQTNPSISGTTKENQYDHTRVKLEIINNDPYSGYINTNYISGYKVEKGYIAIQNPNSCTVNEFWRMIWQEKVETIVSLGSLAEEEVHIYWPELDCEKHYGSITVKQIFAHVTANYEIRNFHVFYNQERLFVSQYHFIDWPEGGVPLYFQALGPFCKKLSRTFQGRSPTVVHSREGSGRTGSFILCDICLRMATEEGKVAIFDCLQKLREQRMSLVGNVEQYIMVYLVLLQCLVIEEMRISYDNIMEEEIERMTKERILGKMDYLESLSWQNDAISNKLMTKKKPDLVISPEVNEVLSDSLPISQDVPYSICTGVVEVDSYHTVSKFVITQNPLKSTVADFWKLVKDSEITTIVSLNYLDFTDETTSLFYPMGGICTNFEPLPGTEVEYVGKETKEFYEIYSLLLKCFNSQESNLTIKVIQINNWYYTMLHPENPGELIKIYKEMSRFGKHSTKILFTCYDGTRASGLFAALCSVIDRTRREPLYDVFSAVITVKQASTKFMRDVDQILFLYECSLEYIRQIEEELDINKYRF